MRNIRILKRKVTKSHNIFLPLTSSAWDVTSDALICAFGPASSDQVIELRRLPRDSFDFNSAPILASWDTPCPLPELDCDKIISLHWLSESSTACVVLAGGDIVLVRESPLPGEELIEIVGSIDAGISAARWSPDEELLAISTNADTLLLMTRDFDVTANIALSADDVKISSHVSVGWGKSETQFKGKRAKALRDPTIPEKIDDGSLSRWDAGNTSISWRGDGQYLALNKIEESRRRMIRVYSRDGALDSVSEPVDGLEGSLSWRPAGNLLAGVRRREEGPEVAFFERNGLRHGQFDLRAGSNHIEDWSSAISIQWNIDSSVLAVSFKDRVHLWTMGNYHYYLKQEIVLESEPPSEGPVHVIWHPEKPFALALEGNGVLEHIEFNFEVTSSPTNIPYDLGVIPVIDGKNLRLTPLRITNIPPPMALHNIRVDDCIKDAAVNGSSTEIVILTRKYVTVYSYNPSNTPVKAPSVLWQQHLQKPSLLPRQVAYRGDSSVSILMDDFRENQCQLGKCTAENVVYSTLGRSASIISICASRDYKNLYIQYSDGSVHDERCAESDESIDNPIANFPREVVHFTVARIGAENIAFGLASNGSLYLGESVILRGCTSFHVTEAHLIVTTSQHFLKFIHLKDASNLEIPPDEPETDERCRTIERRARLVAVMPSSFAVALQMPRGNLETIYPRALVLPGIRRSVAAKEYRAAFLACRSQRVDMNIIFDYAPQQFLDNVSLFLGQVKKAEFIDLFLSQISEEDVTKTLYRETLIGNHDNEQTVQVNGVTITTSVLKKPAKVNKICDAVLEELRKNPTAHLQNIITANVCKNPPDYEGGLRVVAELQKQGEGLAEKAAEHICFLADANKLYDHALGLKDLELTLLIAQQSQKDPREYLPYLQSLQEMSPLRRAFTINDHLGRRTKAIRHLNDLDAFEELELYTQKHDLYLHALELLKYEKHKYNKIMRIYADHLVGISQYKKAGIAFEYLLDYAKATEAYHSATSWREALSCATMVPLPSDEMTSLSQLLADSLAESKDFTSAATIHVDYLNDVETAARTLCKGYHFAEAFRVMGLRQRHDLVESVIDVGLVEGSANMTELLADCKSQLAAQVPRLRELRVKKDQDPLSFYDGADSTADVPDNVSIAPSAASTSGTTLMTRYTSRTGSVGTATTRRTSKNRRREERKRARGKKGSVYEEEYLVASVGRLVERVNSTGDEVERLVEGLVRRGMRERAAAVETAMGEVVGACKAAVDEAFGMRKEGGQTAAEQEERPPGGDGVLWDAIEEQSRPKEPPLVKNFAKLALLD